jgi:hypothetical protein
VAVSLAARQIAKVLSEAEAECKMSILKRLDKLGADYHRTSWEVLRRLGRSPAFSSIVFYPLVAGLISFNQSAVSIFFIEGWFSLNTSLVWRMYSFYAALMLLFIGSIFYAFWCPEMLKRYENSLEYGKSELDILSHPVFCADVHGFIERRLDTHHSAIGRFAPHLCRNLRDALKAVDNEITADRGRISEAAVSAMMLAHWQFMNRAYPWGRLVVFMSYWAGLGLLFFVSLLSVLEILYNAFGS